MSDWYGFEDTEQPDEDDLNDGTQQPLPISKRVQGQIAPVQPTPPPPPIEMKTIYMNKYRHCGIEWEDVWDCTCNDKCPVCNDEIEPYESEDLSDATI